MGVVMVSTNPYDGRTREARLYDAGYTDGASAGSWVVDGNTSRETAESLVRMDADGDPELFDYLPELHLSDDPGFEEICDGVGVRYDQDSDQQLWSAYSDGWYTGVRDQALRDAHALTEGS